MRTVGCQQERDRGARHRREVGFESSRNSEGLLGDVGLIDKRSGETPRTSTAVRGVTDQLNFEIGQEFAHCGIFTEFFAAATTASADAPEATSVCAVDNALSYVPTRFTTSSAAAKPA